MQAIQWNWYLKCDLPNIPSYFLCSSFPQGMLTDFFFLIWSRNFLWLLTSAKSRLSSKEFHFLSVEEIDLKILLGYLEPGGRNAND